MTAPDISVVMSVFNNEDTVAETIDSVLIQQGVNFEFIIVNDGSTDQTASILKRFADLDSRIRLLSRPSDSRKNNNRGLTQSLIEGCELAQGEFIARQDAGDISYQGRFEQQFQILKTKLDVAMVSSATEFVTPKLEHLFTVIQAQKEAQSGLEAHDPADIKGPPHHGSVMFRRSSYELVGAYRKEFTVAQDIDLWTRLAEHGQHYSLQNVLYRATIEKNSISSTKREQQLNTVEFIVECIKAREKGQSEVFILNQLKKANEAYSNRQSKAPTNDSAYYYFLASNLFTTQPALSKGYLIKALKENVFHWRALLKLIKLSVSLRVKTSSIIR